MQPTFVFILLFYNIDIIYCGTEINPSESSPSTENPPPQQTNPTKPSEEILIEPTDPQPEPSTALQLIRMKKKQGFRWSRNKHMQSGETMVNLCPAESPEELAIVGTTKLENCLLVKDESKTALEERKCEKEIEPKLWNVADGKNQCGENDSALLYTYIHQVCWKSKSILSKLSKFNLNFMDDIFPQIEEDYIEIYTTCWLYQKETVYVKYTLVSTPRDELEEALKSYDLPTETNGPAKLDFGKLLTLFDKQKQRESLGKMFGTDFTDYLIPQKFISPAHITPSLAKHSLHNYLNVGPQWFSMDEKWQDLEIHLWNLGLESKETIFIFAGTYGKITGLTIKIDEFTSFSVPSIWWKLIINVAYEEGIIIAMQNEPANHPLSDEKLCSDSICNSSGWEEINEIAYCCEFNEEMRKKLNSLDKEAFLFTINQIFNPKKEIKSKPKYKPRIVESRWNKWLKKVFKRKPKDLI